MHLIARCLLLAVAVAAVAPARGEETPAAPAGWSCFRGSSARTGNVDGLRGPKAPAERWRFAEADAKAIGINASPAVDKDRVYVAAGQRSVFGDTGRFYCLDADGKLLWKAKLKRWGFSSPAVVGGRVFVGEGLHEDENCRLYCLDAESGKELWTFAAKSHIESSPVAEGGRVYFGAGEDGVFCAAAEDGKETWHYADAHVDLSPALGGGKLFVGTGYGKTGAIALDAATGKPAWVAATDLPVWGSPAVSGDRVYYGIGNGDFRKSSATPKGAVIALEAGTGKVVWRRDIPDAVLTAIVHDGKRLVFGSRDGNVYAADPATGDILWKGACGGPVLTSPAVVKDMLYVVGGDLSVRLFNAATGELLWKHDLAGMPADEPVELFSSPAIAGGRLIFGTGKGQVIALGAR
jgi:outer membrane protein assembly factor BamB